MPTFRVGDRFVARMSPPVPLNRGDIVLVHTAVRKMPVDPGVVELGALWAGVREQLAN